MPDTDIVVLGGGPGGYPAAFAAADHGMDVTLVDEGIKPGGVCLHRGCIPSKALLHAARLINETKEATDWGLTFSAPKIDIDRLRGWKEGIVEKLTGGIEGLCAARGVKYIRARGKFLDSQTLELQSQESGTSKLTFNKAVIATGSLPVIPSPFRLDDPRIMDSTGALALEDVPKKMLVVGGGYIGLEMGTVYASLGSKVTVVEMQDGLLPGADRDLVKPLAKRLESQFESILLKTRVDKMTPSRKGIKVDLSDASGSSSSTFDRVLISVGRTPNSGNLGLENTQVKLTERGFIQVNDVRQTTDPHLLAIGDVAGEPMLAHKATYEAKVAIEALAGEPASYHPYAIPAVVFTDPEIAWCGLTENEAKAAGRKVSVFRFPWAASGRAQTLARTEGMTKVISDPETERILGVGIVGVGAGELIAEAVLAVEMGSLVRDMAETIHAHPTMSETMMESAEGLLGQATHVYRPKK